MSLSRLVFRAGCGIRLYRFLIIVFLVTLQTDDTIPKIRGGRNQHSMVFQNPIANTMFIKVASSPRLSGIGMLSPIL